MPKFTEAQLARLPYVLKKIQEDAGYRRLMQKRGLIEDIKNDAGVAPWSNKVMKYDSLASSKKISKLEVIAVKQSIIDLLKEAGVLEIVHEEVTIEMMQAWLEANKPVFMISGSQVNLQRMGLDGLVGIDGLVREYLPDSDEVKKAIDIIHERKAELETPSVAFTGGGPSATSSAVDFLKKVEPKDLQVVWISPEEKAPSIPRKIVLLHTDDDESMKYEWIPGYISDLIFEDDKSIQKIKVFDLVGRKDRDIECDLLVHTHNQYDYFGSEAQTTRINGCRDHITRMLDEKSPGNRLVRDLAIYPEHEYSDLALRIENDWTVDLEDDELLVKEIDRLVRRESGGNHAGNLVVSGKNPMIKRVMFLAAMRGYRGYYRQISVPAGSRQRTADADNTLKTMKERCSWREFKGRLVKDGTSYHGKKFSLGVINQHGEPVSNVPHVDAIINEAGKTKITPLVQAMERKEYISVFEGEELVSKNPTLFGGTGFFKKDLNDLSHQEVEFPSATLAPANKAPYRTEPLEWKEIFDTTLRLLTNVKA
jgi:hypothetical protein